MTHLHLRGSAGGKYFLFPRYLGVIGEGGEMICCVFLCVFFVVQVSGKKKLDRGVCGWGLANPSFSRIFGFF